MLPHLTIDNQTIVCDLQASLQVAAITPNYREYMQKKFNWTTADCQNVNWLSLWLTLQRFKPCNRICLQNFFTTGYRYVWQSMYTNQPWMNTVLFADSTTKIYGISLSVSTPPDKPCSVNFSNSFNNYTTGSVLIHTYSNSYGKG